MLLDIPGSAQINIRSGQNGLQVQGTREMSGNNFAVAPPREHTGFPAWPVPAGAESRTRQFLNYYHARIITDNNNSYNQTSFAGGGDVNLNRFVDLKLLETTPQLLWADWV